MSSHGTRAMSRGVDPSLDLTFTSAPALMRLETISGYPKKTAAVIAVEPSRFFLSNSAPKEISKLTASFRPKVQAAISGVVPSADC